MHTSICKICGNEAGNTSFQAKEMMFGFRDGFTYVHCAVCGVVQIESVPENIAKYYPENYYSYSSNDSTSFSFKKWRQGQVYNHHFGKRSLLGAFVSLFSSKPAIWMNRKYLCLNSKILDVGSGSGKLLLDMQRGGFTKLVGVDPFLEKDIQYDCGVNIYKKSFFDITETFDFIMFHHSFEHMDQPQKIFSHLYKILNKGCFALIRIPVADSFSFRKYGAEWVNLDPPRHFFLYTTKSINFLAAQSGLSLKETIYDSNQFQFYGSELYRRNLTLDDYNKGLHPDLFTKTQMRNFRAEANRLNKINDGDWACFYFFKP